MALSLATCATLLGADDDSGRFRAPEPEEIEEAFQSGLIDYPDYRALLEIARSDVITASDSLFLLEFPDLMAGYSATLQTVLDAAEPVDRKTSGAVTREWRHSFLLRQCHAITQPALCRRIIRVQGLNDDIAFYSEMEQPQPGGVSWNRRSVAYSRISDSGNGFRVAAGNVREQFGMGIMYGYHGQLLSHAGDGDADGSFLYPRYGGTNGLVMSLERPSGTFKLLFDVDRNSTFAKSLTALSIPVRLGGWDYQVSGGWGVIRNRETGRRLEATLVSIFTQFTDGDWSLTSELAAASTSEGWMPAGSAALRWKRGGAGLRMDAWSYDDDYISYFAGGPSSRRSRTIAIEEIGLSYSDRYRGEKGVLATANHPVSRSTSIHSAIEYASRSFDDDRLEVGIGFRRTLGRGMRAQFDCYQRSDHLYSDDSEIRRVQLEVAGHGEVVSGRIVIGRKEEKYNVPDDYLVLVGGAVQGAWGRLSVNCKFDHFRPDDPCNQYMYMTAAYDAGLARTVTTHVGYSYRYRRDTPDDDRGTFRWDLKWTIK